MGHRDLTHVVRLILQEFLPAEPSHWPERPFFFKLNIHQSLIICPNGISESQDPLSSASLLRDSLFSWGAFRYGPFWERDMGFLVFHVSPGCWKSRQAGVSLSHPSPWQGPLRPDFVRCWSQCPLTSHSFLRPPVVSQAMSLLGFSRTSAGYCWFVEDKFICKDGRTLGLAACKPAQGPSPKGGG